MANRGVYIVNYITADWWKGGIHLNNRTNDITGIAIPNNGYWCVHSYPEACWWTFRKIKDTRPTCLPSDTHTQQHRSVCAWVVCSCLVFQINDVWLGDRCEGLADWRELMGRSVAQTHPGSPCLLSLRLLIGLTTLPCCSHTPLYIYTHTERHPDRWTPMGGSAHFHSTQPHSCLPC